MKTDFHKLVKHNHRLEGFKETHKYDSGCI